MPTIAAGGMHPQGRSGDCVTDDARQAASQAGRGWADPQSRREYLGVPQTVNLESEVMTCVAEALALDPAAAARLSPQTALLGAHPDFNSMAVLTLLTALEDRLGLSIADDIDAEAFTSIGSLLADLRRRLPGAA
jgi:acyl carrier protein